MAWSGRAPTPAFPEGSGQVVDYEAKALYVELWRERHPIIDRVTTEGGPTDRNRQRRALSPIQLHWHNGSVVKVVHGDGSQYLYDDELDSEYLEYHWDSNYIISFDAWLRLVKVPAPDHLSMHEDLSIPESQSPISAPMRMPVSGIDEIVEGVDDVLAGRVEQGVVEPGGSLVPRRPDQTPSPAQANLKRPRPDSESTCTEASFERQPNLKPLPASPLSSSSYVAPPSCASTALDSSSPEF